eukprot:GHRR01036799.1.p1 GENE.GHRR01036799.1~~GHRR01036799.1.p1  ORF type:complete len:158 (+),score=33.91 GHRR01036799.1:2342-2815(+)
MPQCLWVILNAKDLQGLLLPGRLESICQHGMCNKYFICWFLLCGSILMPHHIGQRPVVMLKVSHSWCTKQFESGFVLCADGDGLKQAMLKSMAHNQGCKLVDICTLCSTLSFAQAILALQAASWGVSAICCNSKAAVGNVCLAVGGTASWGGCHEHI